MSVIQELVMAGAVRATIGKLGGTLAHISVTELGAVVNGGEYASCG